MRRIGRLLAGTLSALILAGASEHGSCAPDYAREARLADEVAPAIVVGDPVYLSTAAQPRILAIYTEASPPAIAKASAIVVHGSGVHPDWGLNNGSVPAAPAKLTFSPDFEAKKKTQWKY